jgi:hypothetical protein
MAVVNQNLYRAFDLFELTPANEINFLDSYKKTLSKCCIDPLRPPNFTGTIRGGNVIHPAASASVACSEGRIDSIGETA